MNKIEIYTDGGCSVHSGKVGCWAYAVVLNDELLGEDYGVVENTTNGKMEVLAMKNALNHALEHCELIADVEITIKSDSQYCVNSYNDWAFGWEKRGWKKSNNKAIEHVEDWKQMHSLRHSRVKVEWVRGHDGNKWNEYVDKLTHNR